MKFRKILPCILMSTSLALTGCQDNTGYKTSKNTIENKVEKEFDENSKIIEGVLKEGPYNGYNFKIQIDSEKTDITIYHENDMFGEKFYMRGLDKGNDGSYEKIDMKLESKETTRDISKPAEDLRKIVKKYSQ